MEVLSLLLMLLTVSGHSHILQPMRLDLSDMRNVSLSVEEKEKAAEEEQRNEELTPETNPEKNMEGKNTAGFTGNIGGPLNINEGYEKGSEESLTPEMFSENLRAETKREELDTNRGDEENGRELLETNEKRKPVKETRETIKTLNSRNTRIQGKGEDDESDKMHKLSQEIEEEEKESELVAGISVHQGSRGGANEGAEKISAGNQENVEEKQEEEVEKNANYKELEGDQSVVSDLTPPADNTYMMEEIPTIQMIPQSPSSTPQVKVSPHFLPPHHILGSTAAPEEALRLLTEVLQSPGHHLNELEGSDLEGVIVKNILFEPAQRETTREITDQLKKDEFIPKVQAAMPKPTKVTKDLNSSTKPNENNPTGSRLELTEPTGKPKTAEVTENDTKLTVRRRKTSPQTQLTETSVKTTARTPSTRPTKNQRSSKNKTVKKPKDKKRKKDNKTQKLAEKKEVAAPTHFPYFMDDYCPPECACYGRVVQCSDKGVDKVPYGIPYNARYVLLMNNLIDSIQLDLLNEYVSMEFLVLSNNRLTDGSIEGAFEGIPALKRLYLDRNLLESVPTDLPVSLEELRLDNNQLGVMSEAAWARCPDLLVLSLSNNSLGNGSHSLPDAVLLPLTSLRTLNLDHNQLTSVPLGLPLSIKELYLKGNLIDQFRSGAFNGISELLVLDLSSNRLTNKGLLRESLLNATHLESLNLEGNRLKQVPRHLPRSLKTLNLEGNLITSIKKAALSILKNLEHLGLARNKIVKVAPGAFKALPVLHQLDLCHNTLQQVPRQLPRALHSVTLTHNRIQSVPRDAFCWGDQSLGLSWLVRVQLEHNLIDMGKLDAQAFRCLRGFQVVHFY